MSDRILDPDGINTPDRLDKPVDGEPIPIRQDNADDDVIPSPDDTPPPQPTDTPPPDEAPPKKDDEPMPDLPKPIDEPNMPLPPLV